MDPFRTGIGGVAMRILLSGLALLLLAGCQPPIPDSRVGGVGFENYSDYQARRYAEAQARINAPSQVVQAPVQNPVVPYPAPAGSATGAPSAAELAQAGIGSAPLAGSAGLPANIPPANPQVTEGAYYPATKTDAATAPVNHAGISDEQDFNAVAARETIESDKARIAENRAQYQQVQPTELPERTGASSGAVDLIQYALSAPNRIGETVYPRSKIALTNSQKACARYDSPEAAQQAFLKAGGPKRDPKNLDPDGDGFACFWDPTPFQKARG
ncbi:MAG: hypothetical protein B7Z02_01475 [Rhodobacterales bacterium 32-67-9]|nr:MAG: hypothetical protein B7Z02_01475 [Rhodobacterales bacterium 32-67-9]